MRMPLTAEDIVIGVLYHLKKKSISKVTTDRQKLHRAFFEASQKHPEALSAFCFRQREVFPESVQLDQAFSNLDATGLISRRNLAPRFYFIEDVLNESYSSYSKDILRAAGLKDNEMKKVAAEIGELVLAS